MSTVTSLADEDEYQGSPEPSRKRGKGPSKYAVKLFCETGSDIDVVTGNVVFPNPLEMKTKQKLVRHLPLLVPHVHSLRELRESWTIILFKKYADAVPIGERRLLC